MKFNTIISDNNLTKYTDSIIMLTSSDWSTELRSNRYHYATRFSKCIQVIFVQPDLTEQKFEFENIETHDIKILHIYSQYDETQVNLLNQALRQLKIIKPMFWIYNGYFEKIIAQRYSALNVFHATEDYFTSDSRIKIKDKELLNSFNNILLQCDLVVAVSNGVKESIELNTKYNGIITVSTNGCDYKFYEPNQNNLAKSIMNNPQKNIAIYQGNIFDKIDYDIMHKLANKMTDWQFLFCGKVVFNEPEWESLCKLSNVKYIGLLSPDELRKSLYNSTVGIIPFVQSDWIIERSLPLKTFEYLASGLPVVTVPIKSLLPYSDVIEFATNVEEFEIAIRKSAKLRFDSIHLKLRLNIASKQDYDLKFLNVTKEIISSINHKKKSSLLNVAILYEPNSINVGTIKEYLSSFNMFSKHNIYYLPASQGIECSLNLNVFDSIVIHYSIRLSVCDGNYCLSPSYVNAIQNYIGYKVLILQDEYEGTENARNWISSLGIHTVYTCIPKQHIEKIYSKSRFPYVKFINILTGYVPMSLPPIKTLINTVKRKKFIGYRGRALPFWYGDLGQEKLNIGIKIKEFCINNKLETDIEWDDSKRIYGDNWYTFLSECRATLGTESGANIFDINGEIRSAIEEKLKNNPNLTYADIYDECIAPHETIPMNQISPKIFEAISLHTALILFEGEYSGIIKPDIHYISLKKDFSNIKDVFDKLNNDNFIEKMTERAYKDIVLSKKYSYESFINEFDSHLSLNVRKNINIKKQILTSIGFISNNHNYTIFSSTNNTTLPSKELFSLEKLQLIDSTLNSKNIFLPEVIAEKIELITKNNCNEISTEEYRKLVLKTLTTIELRKIITIKIINKIINFFGGIFPPFCKKIIRKCTPIQIKHQLKLFLQN